MLSVLLRAHFEMELVVGILVFLGIIIFLAVYFSKTARIKRKLRSAPRRGVGEVQEGEVVKVAGQIAPVGQTLTAPLSGRSCVYYHVKVEQYKRRGRSSYWEVIINEEVKGDVVLKDGSSYALVDTSGKLMSHLVPDKKFNSGFMKDADHILQGYLSKHGVNSTNWLGMNKTLRFNEGVLEPGETVAAYGKASSKRKGQTTHNVSIERFLFISPTDTNEAVYLTDEPSVMG